MARAAMTLLSCLLLSAALLMPASAPAQTSPTWPTRPVKLIQSGPAGAPPDLLARALAQRLQQRFGQPFIVENRPGANGIVGAQACAASAPDGHTFCISTNDPVSVNPHLYRKLPYDPDRSFVPVALLAWPNSVIVVGSQVGAKTFKEVVDLSVTRPGTLNWASFGNGSSSHLYLEWIRARTGWDVLHVPYTSGGFVPAVLSGQAHLTYLSIGALKPHIDAGTLIPIAVAGSARSPFLPDVPTFGEVGLGEFYVRTWFGLFAPGGTDEELITRVNSAVVDITHDPAFVAATLNPLTLTPSRETPARMREYIVKDRRIAGELVKAANVELN